MATSIVLPKKNKRYWFHSEPEDPKLSWYVARSPQRNKWQGFAQLQQAEVGDKEDDPAQHILPGHWITIQLGDKDVLGVVCELREVASSEGHRSIHVLMCWARKIKDCRIKWSQSVLNTFLKAQKLTADDYVLISAFQIVEHALVRTWDMGDCRDRRAEDERIIFDSSNDQSLHTQPRPPTSVTLCGDVLYDTREGILRPAHLDGTLLRVPQDLTNAYFSESSSEASETERRQDVKGKRNRLSGATPRRRKKRDVYHPESSAESSEHERRADVTAKRRRLSARTPRGRGNQSSSRFSLPTGPERTKYRDRGTPLEWRPFPAFPGVGIEPRVGQERPSTEASRVAPRVCRDPLETQRDLENGCDDGTEDPLSINTRPTAREIPNCLETAQQISPDRSVSLPWTSLIKRECSYEVDADPGQFPDRLDDSETGQEGSAQDSCQGVIDRSSVLAKKQSEIRSRSRSPAQDSGNDARQQPTTLLDVVSCDRQEEGHPTSENENDATHRVATMADADSRIQQEEIGLISQQENDAAHELPTMVDVNPRERQENDDSMRDDNNDDSHHYTENAPGEFVRDPIEVVKRLAQTMKQERAAELKFAGVISKHREVDDERRSRHDVKRDIDTAWEENQTRLRALIAEIEKLEAKRRMARLICDEIEPQWQEVEEEFRESEKQFQEARRVRLTAQQEAKKLLEGDSHLQSYNTST